MHLIIRRDTCESTFLGKHKGGGHLWEVKFVSNQMAAVFSFLAPGLRGQRAEDDEGKRQQSQQYPADCNTPD